MCSIHDFPYNKLNNKSLLLARSNIREVLMCRHAVPKVQLLFESGFYSSADFIQNFMVTYHRYCIDTNRSPGPFFSFCGASSARDRLYLRRACIRGRTFFSSQSFHLVYRTIKYGVLRPIEFLGQSHILPHRDCMLSSQPNRFVWWNVFCKASWYLRCMQLFYTASTTNY